MHTKNSLLLLALIFFSVGAEAQVRIKCKTSNLYKDLNGEIGAIVKTNQRLEMISAADISLEGNDPYIKQNWVKVYAINAVNLEKEGPFWIKTADFICGELVGR